MRPKKHETTEEDLFRARLDQIIDMKRAQAAARACTRPRDSAWSRGRGISHVRSCRRPAV
jgi:hypothetical protein